MLDDDSRKLFSIHQFDPYSVVLEKLLCILRSFRRHLSRRYHHAHIRPFVLHSCNELFHGISTDRGCSLIVFGLDSQCQAECLRQSKYGYDVCAFVLVSRYDSNLTRAKTA